MKFILTASSVEDLKDWKKLGFSDKNGISDSSIEINTLEELMIFIEEHGQIVLNRKRIEIYNDYRE